MYEISRKHTKHLSLLIQVVCGIKFVEVVKTKEKRRVFRGLVVNQSMMTDDGTQREVSRSYYNSS